MECATTGRGATWRTEGVVPESVEKKVREGVEWLFSLHMGHSIVYLVSQSMVPQPVM